VLRAQVGKQTGVRYTPSLAFIADVVAIIGTQDIVFGSIDR